MGERWIKEAEDLKAAGSSGTMSRNHNNPKVTWHVTVSHPGSFESVHRVLTNKRSEPHIVYDPKGDRLGQYFPLDRGARALRNDGATPTNRDGTINIQIEVCAMPGDKRKGIKGFTEIPEFDPDAPNWKALMRAIRSWGIPDEWPAGPPAPSNWASDGKSRSWHLYRKEGHLCHADTPGNFHWDTGWISPLAIFGGDGKVAKPSTAQPAPGVPHYYDPPVKRSVKSIQKIVGVEADGYYGDKTQAGVAKLQRKWGINDDGLWGPATESAYIAHKGGGKGGKKAPDFPLPKGHWYGIESSNPRNHSGYYAKDRAGIKQWQRRMKRRGWTISVDGIFGDQSDSVARAFQREKDGLAVDGLIGNDTWRAAWTEPIT